MESTPTEKDILAVVMAARALGDTIQSLGAVPSGTLYAAVMGKMSYSTYEGLLDMLVSTGMVRRDGSHLLIWTGPTFEGRDQ